MRRLWNLIHNSPRSKIFKIQFWRFFENCQTLVQRLERPHNTRNSGKKILTLWNNFPSFPHLETTLIRPWIHNFFLPNSSISYHRISQIGLSSFNNSKFFIDQERKKKKFQFYETISLPSPRRSAGHDIRSSSIHRSLIIEFLNSRVIESFNISKLIFYRPWKKKGRKKSNSVKQFFSLVCFH